MLLLDQVTEHPPALGVEDVERIGRHVAQGFRLQGEQSDLRTVAVRDDQLVTRRELRDRSDRRAYIGALHFGVGALSALKQGVAAQCHDQHQ